MFSKILIANRGEIACRVIRTAKRMGIATVAVYSDADARAPHVKLADESVRLGPAPAAQSYLNPELILDAIRMTGAQAVHPGYGFLSERESFARALDEAGVAFIGPPADAIAAMGDKIESKKLAQAAGVSVVPGHIGEIRDTEHAVEIAGGIGYPVMMKASAGGGGKGMRLAYSEADVREGFEATRREGLASFGDDRVFIEKFVTSPRHIEIQLLGDKHGNTVYLGERECSIQRRHQKVVEEAPSPFVTPEMRRAMGEQAVALAKAVGYHSAGTVEFIAGADRSFYFLEMNTRLQVEHPVTEEVTGLDLVEQMIRVAAGEPLSYTQDDVRLNGWSVETRVYAEDPYRGFLPSTGRLVRYATPEAQSHQELIIARSAATRQSISGSQDLAEPSGDGLLRSARNDGEVIVRVDDGVAEGGEVSMFYDPMIAKLITWGETREEAIDAQIAALDAFEIQGIGHNVDFLSALMQHPRFRSGELTTGFIAEEYPEGFAGAPANSDLRRRLAALAGAMSWLEAERAREVSGQLGQALPPPDDWVVRLDGEDHQVTVADGSVLVDGETLGVELDWDPGDRRAHAVVGDEALTVGVQRGRIDWRLTTRGATHRARALPRSIADLARHMIEKAPPDHSNHLLSPMPGLLTQLHVAEGDKVEAGQPLAVVEAMKMENILRASKSATVAKVAAQPGASLAVDQIILEFA